MPDKRKSGGRAAPEPAPDQVEVRAVTKFRHDGVYTKLGQRIVMTAADAASLLAMGWVQPLDRRVGR
jgi:hypothetical protein